MIDVIIVNYKSSAYLMQCLASIEQSGDRHRPALYIEDNASDRSIDTVEAAYGSTCIAKHRNNFGFAAAVNRALNRSSSPYVMLLNPDTCVADGLFDTVIDFMEANPDVGVVGPKVLNADGRIQGSARTFPNALTALFGRNSLLTRLFPNNRISRSNILTTRSDGKTPMDVDWVSGACMVVRRSAIEQVGPLDERFFMYWEDTDWCRRMWRHRQRVVYLPTATVTHRVGGSSARSVFLSVLRFHLSAYRLFAKYNHRFPHALLKPFVACGLIARLGVVLTMWTVRWMWQRFRALSRWMKRPPATQRTGNNVRATRVPMGHSEAIPVTAPAVPEIKSPKHVLILNQYYPPDQSATAQVLAQMVDVLSHRFQVTLLAGRPSYRPRRFYPWRPVRRFLGRRASIIRVGSTALSRYNMIGRVLNYLTYVALALPGALVIRTEVILAMTDPPLAGTVGAIAASLRRKPFIYSIQDLHPDMAVAAGMIRPGFAVRLWEMLHRWTLRRADRVFVLGEDMRQRIIRKGILPDRVMVIRSGSDAPMELPAADDPVVQRLRGGLSLSVVHAGNIGHYGAWTTCIDAFARMPKNGVGMLFVGDGAAKAELMAAADGVSTVRFVPFEPRENLPHVMAAGDLQVITIRRGLEGMVVPSKFYSILASGRPVLAVAPDISDAADVVKQYGCGVVVDPDNPEALTEAIRAIAADPSQLEEMAQNSRRAARELAREGQLARIVAEVDRLAAEM